MKSSDVFLSIKSYEILSQKCNYPLHLGITEAGGLFTGSIKSSIGIGQLLMKGIGDTIRVSLSDDPVQEVKIGNEILKSIGIRNRGVKIISCPSCARQGFKVIDTVKILEENFLQEEPINSRNWVCCKRFRRAAFADIGVTGGGKESNMLYLNGFKLKS